MTLYILDLDHTLIYGSYAPRESAKVLFKYNKYLTVYERPYARELVKLVQKLGDVIVYTTAKADYARKICQTLGIRPLELLTRRNCLRRNGEYKKRVLLEWESTWDNVIIIDDSPNVWTNVEADKIRLIAPSKYMGSPRDDCLEFIIMNEFSF